MYIFRVYYNQQSINLFLAWYHSQPVYPVMYSIYCKSLLFTSISHVQENFKLNEVSQSNEVFFFIGGFPLTYNIIWL